MIIVLLLVVLLLLPVLGAMGEANKPLDEYNQPPLARTPKTPPPID